MNEINMTNKKLSRNIPRRLGMLVLALCMALSLLPIPPVNAAFSDAAMDKLLNWGVVSGYPDGALHPDWPLTRAEFVAMVNRAYGYTELGNTPFIDVPNNAWFRDDINIGYTANYFTGVSPRMAGPDQKLTREQAMVLLARNMRMQPADGEVTDFTDGRDFSDWSRGYARAAREAGVIGGYGDGSYKPKNNITRGEMAVMLQRALGTLINKPGTHTLSDVYGNVTISSPNVVLKNSTIVGNLYITGGLSLGDVTLENVRVLGDIIVAGGGESQSGESVILRNVQANSLIVDSIAGQYVSLASEGDTVIGNAILRTSAYVQDRTRPGEGLLNITLDSLQQEAAFTLSGNLETVVNKTPRSTLKIAMGTVSVLNIDEEARESTLQLDINSTVGELNLDTGITVTGVGDIGDLFVNAPGADIEMLPDRVTIRPGLTADVAGQTMNAQQAQESSSDPRLHAGYPKVKNIAPTNATSVYSANKGGTVYWAVSNTTDGSIGEEELIEPSDDNTRIELSGTTPVGQSGTEYTAALEQLTPDSNYYLSTIMVDARGRRSPIKVASFATPDNTVPAFAQGYPTVMKNYSQPTQTTITVDGIQVTVTRRDEDGYPVCNYRVQIAAMPNKTCQLYYALYPAGSIAPTAQQFRTGALGGPIRSGMEDASKNRINFIELTNLEELTTYDVYLCYIDADGSRSSAVRKLTFTTVDGKPPRFQYETPIVTQEQLTSLRLNANVNENATIYWVATRDVNYVKDNDNWSDTEWWERAARQIESGTGGISSGNVAARANTDVAINVGGLQAATRYYIFFVAKDAAGNYSEFFRATRKTDGGIINPGDDPNIDPPQQYTPHNQSPYKYYLFASTLDNIPPTATQEFTHFDATDPTRPYADTNIEIHFSEAVMQYSTHRDKAQEDFRDFYTLYTELVAKRDALEKIKAEGGDTEAQDKAKDALDLAEAAFCNALRGTIRLYNNSDTDNDPLKRERNAANEASIGDDWLFDYRYVEVEYDADTGEMTVIFPTDPDHPEKSALNLSSGSTYHFVLDDICDTSSSKNRMGRTSLPDFTTISAQVNLRTIGVTRVNYQNPQTGKPETNIPIDMAFSMTPVSTSVEDEIVWDLLFWSDTSCEFEVYEIEENSNGSNATAIRPLVGGSFPTSTGHYSFPIIVNLDERPDPDLTADNYRGYLGASYFGNFYGVGAAFPSVTGKGEVLADYSRNEDVNLRGVMQQNKPKFYGIHFTSIDNVDEEKGRDKTWNAMVNFRISVVTSTNGNYLDNLSRNISNETITSFDGGALGGSIIHSPRPFSLQKQFANTTAPEFDPQYPTFDYTDTKVTMTLLLDRPGKVYYVIAPASTWPTGAVTKTYSLTIPTYAFDGTIAGTRLETPTNTYDTTDDTTYERYWATIAGARRNVPRDAFDTTVPYYYEDPETYQIKFDTNRLTAKFEVTQPTNNQIYSGRNAGSRAKVGSWEQTGYGSENITVEGLEPDTVYIVYFVTQGTGQVYSERAQIFQFVTEPVYRPELDVQSHTSYATIVSKNMDATVDTGLFFTSSLDRITLLNKKLATVIDPKARADWEAVKGRDNSATGNKFEQDTVWEAIITQYNSQGSLFDYFADEATKNDVAALIRNQVQNAERIDGDSGVFLPENGSPTPFSYDLQEGRYYILLAVAHSAGVTNASGHSLGFGGARPLYALDMGQPTITDIGGTLNVSYTADTAPENGYVMDGFITLTFDRPLYLNYPPETTTGKDRNDPLTGKMLSQYFLTNDVDGAFKPFDTDEGGAVRSVRIDFREIAEGGVTQGMTFTVNRRLSGENSGSRNETLTIRIVFHPELADDPSVDSPFTAVVSYPDVWFPSNHVTISLNKYERPLADGVYVSTVSNRIPVGGTWTIPAQLTPAGATGTIRYTIVDGGDYVRCSDSGGIVTGLKAGTAHIKVQAYAGGAPVGSAETVTVTVYETGSLTLSVSSIELRPGQNPEVTVTIDVPDGVDKTMGKPIISDENKVSAFQIGGVVGNVARYAIQITGDYSPKTNELPVTITFRLKNHEIYSEPLTVYIRPVATR